MNSQPPAAAGPAPAAELTARAVALGLGLSIVMGAANVYLGLKAGMTVSASIPAAVLAMLALRAFRGTVLECNQVQTGASAGESLAAGVIFTMPALVLIGAWQRFDVWLTTLVAGTGGLLGVLFMVPMRRVFVTGGSPELKFPEGLACAAVLQAGTAPAAARSGSAGDIVRGALLGGVYKVLASSLGLIQGALEGAVRAGRSVLYLGADVSPALVAVGCIVGLNVSLLVFVGGALSWLIGIPLLSASGGGDARLPALEAAWELWSGRLRYVGVGCMVVGGIASIWRVRRGLVHAVAELGRVSGVAGGVAGGAAAGGAAVGDSGRDISGRVLAVTGAVAVAVVGLIYYRLTGSAAIALVTTGAMVAMSFFFTAVASYIVGLVGNSNSPVSGMTITSVLFTGLLLVVFGFSGMAGMVATLGVAAVVCCAACTAGDVCNDLRTGFLVGAHPGRQQVMQILGVLVACVVMAPVLQLLHEYTPGGIGGRELPAPQAALFASLVRGLFGDGHLPWEFVGAGAVLGLVVLALDQVLQRRSAGFRVHLMPLAVGMYLPFGLAIPILVGGLINHAAIRGRDEADAERRGRRGMLFSSGSIAGESLVGVGLAGLASVGVHRIDLGVPAAWQTALTAIAAAGMVVCFVRASLPTDH